MNKFIVFTFLSLTLIGAGCQTKSSEVKDYQSKNTRESEIETNKPSIESSKAVTPILNKTSKEYAIMGREVWSAFTCSVLASNLDKTEEGEKLFLFGYKQGKTFLEAFGAGKIERDDISQAVPIGVTMLMGGPSEDFVLGRIFSAAADEALKDIYKTGDEFNSKEMQEVLTANKFQEGNCQLIGN